MAHQRQGTDNSEPPRTSDNEQEPLIRRSREQESSKSIQEDRFNSVNSQTKRFSAIFALLSSGRLMAALYDGFVQVSITCAIHSTLSLFVQRTFSWNPSAAGLIFFAISGSMFFSPVAGALSDRFGARIMVLTGFTTAALTLLCLVHSNNMAQKIVLAVLRTCFHWWVFHLSCSFSPTNK